MNQVKKDSTLCLFDEMNAVFTVVRNWIIISIMAAFTHYYYELIINKSLETIQELFWVYFFLTTLIFLCLFLLVFLVIGTLDYLKRYHHRKWMRLCMLTIFVWPFIVIYGIRVFEFSN